MDKRIILDKSVLLSSSVQASIEDLDSDIEHRFYEMSAKLMDKIEENREIGWLTNEVENDSLKLLGKVVRERIEEMDDLPDPEDMDLLYEVITMCNMKLNERISICNRVSIREEDWMRYLEDVRDLYLNLKSEFESEYPGPPREQVVNRSDLYLTERTIKELERNKRDKAFTVLRRKLVKDPPEFEDKKILSQTIHLNEARFEDEEVFFASCDQHFVGVKRAEESKNKDMIPDEIRDEFGIKCVWPDQMAQEHFD